MERRDALGWLRRRNGRPVTIRLRVIGGGESLELDVYTFVLQDGIGVKIGIGDRLTYIDRANDLRQPIGTDSKTLLLPQEVLDGAWARDDGTGVLTLIPKGPVTFGAFEVQSFEFVPRAKKTLQRAFRR